MSTEDKVTIKQWVKQEGFLDKQMPEVVLKLLRENGVDVRSGVSSVPLEELEKIKDKVSAESKRREARSKKQQASPAKEAAPAEDADKGTARTLKGTLKVSVHKNQGTRPVASVKRVATIEKKADKPLPNGEEVKLEPKPELKTPEDVSKVKLEKATEKIIEKPITPEVQTAQPVAQETKPSEEKEELKETLKEVVSENKPLEATPEKTDPKPVQSKGQMIDSATKKTPAMKAQVFKPDAAILERIKKSQAARPNAPASKKVGQGNRPGGNQQGYTGTFGRSSSGNNKNDNRRQGGQNRSFQGQREGFSGNSMQDVFNARNPFAQHGASANNSSRSGGKTNHGNKNNERNRKDKQEKPEQQEAVRQNVSRVMASLSKNPVKKVYRKDRASEEVGEERKILKTSDFITVGELAGLMSQMPARVIAKCMEMGMMVTINGRLDFETIQVLADEFGFEAQLMEEYEEETLGVEEDAEENLEPRSPVVTVMGHVDHGKTSLLDWIRKSHVVAGESGGITQHIGAYEVTTSQGKVTFLDTPGHEAFSAMRARGSQVTDVIVLVVAADSMVMPQTVESIELAKREKVPIVVAITKIDLPTANPDKIRAQLAERGVEVEQWGGQTSCIEVSARTGQGMQELLETLALETEVLELRANPAARARGAVVESKLDAGKGSMATILIQNGTLHVGDPFVCGIYAGRVRAMLDERGAMRSEAGPSTPCQVLGFDGTPQAGDDLIVVEDDKTAREIASKRRMAARERDLRAKQTMSLFDVNQGIKEGKISELNLIVKADVGGSAEALAASLEKLSNSEVKVNIIRKGVGAITDSDVLFATTAKAVIIAFHLMPSLTVREMASKEGIEIRTYRVIYDCIEDITNVVEGLLKPTVREEIVGEAEIREVFKIPKVGLIAGCMVTDGEVNRDSHVRVYREGVELGATTVLSLKRHKDDVKSVARGFECGIGLKGYDNIEVGDSLIFFKEVKVARTLKDVARDEAEAKKAQEEK